MKRSLLITFSIIIGATIAWTDTGNPPCPPGGVACPCGTYSLMNSTWWCCIDSGHTSCTNYWRNKYLCNSCDPGDPAAFGYYITSSSNTTSLNCDTNLDGNCY